MENLEEFGVRIPEILLPRKIDLETWSVIACDQYTQNFDYWKNVQKTVGENPSTLNLIFPEVYLNDGNGDERIEKIHKTMAEYLDGNLFSSEKMAVYVERETEFGRTRKGLLLAVDLEKYEWKPDAKAPIRATEATVPERIPPRMKIRRGAALELPHIMLLANDPDGLLVEEAGKIAKKNAPVYSGKLMMNSGSIKGWKVAGNEAETQIGNALETLSKSGEDSGGNRFLFAVGDGNHSLATAKALWDEYKANLGEDERKTSRVRYALVEIVNIYDSGLTFEPIHRVIFRQDFKKVLDFVQQKLGGKVVDFRSERELEDFVGDRNAKGARYGFICGSNLKVLETEIRGLAIAALQPVLDAFGGIGKNDIDYIHGTEETVSLGKKPNSISILLPPIAKDSFFQTISERGPLPRKSFSMGEASEKRFYIEARRLF